MATKKTSHAAAKTRATAKKTSRAATKTGVTAKKTTRATAAKPRSARKTSASTAPLSRRQFYKALESRFRFDKSGYFKGGKDVLVMKNRKGDLETQLRSINEIEIEDTDTFFRGAVIMEAPGADEVIHITEPGKYFDHVFVMDHEELYTLDGLQLDERLDVIDVSEKKWLSSTKDQRIAKMPFFDNLLPTSLRDFL